MQEILCWWFFGLSIVQTLFSLFISTIYDISIPVYDAYTQSLCQNLALDNIIESFYDFDKHAIMNLCKIIHENKMNISGVYQKNDKSFWFPDLVVYRMNIQEYILFNPQDDIVYDKLIE